MKPQDKASQSELTPQSTLTILKEGNRRFVETKMIQRSLLEQVKETAAGQFPHSVILGCVDSRISPELVFDQGIGYIFSARVAGNIVNEDILGSMEFATKLAGSKLIVVLGHTSCGAVKGACADVKLGNLSALLAKIAPAVDAAKKDATLDPDGLVQRVAELNVDHVVAEIRAKSEVIDDLVASGEVGLIGAMYSVETGEVVFGELHSGPA